MKNVNYLLEKTSTFWPGRKALLFFQNQVLAAAAAHFEKVWLETESFCAAFRADISPSCHCAKTALNFSGTSMGLLPNCTPRAFAAAMPADTDTYPVYYFTSDTTGEKGYEEFYIPGEKLNWERFQSLGVIEEYPCKDKSEINTFYAKLEALFKKPDFQKAEVVELLKEMVPNFQHEEKGKNLDQKM